jgi:hypothetical protein
VCESQKSSSNHAHPHPECGSYFARMGYGGSDGPTHKMGWQGRASRKEDWPARIWMVNSQSPAFRDMDRAIEINGCLCSDACLFAMAALAGFP